jgi:hypothetical protein
MYIAILFFLGGVATVELLEKDGVLTGSTGGGVGVAALGAGGVA